MNKYHAKGQMKQGLGKGSMPKINGRSSTTPAQAPMPMGTANWPTVPGKTQPSNRSNGFPTSGKLGEFSVKKQGL